MMYLSCFIPSWTYFRDDTNSRQPTEARLNFEMNDANLNKPKQSAPLNNENNKALTMCQRW